MNAALVFFLKVMNCLIVNPKSSWTLERTGLRTNNADVEEEFQGFSPEPVQQSEHMEIEPLVSPTLPHGIEFDPPPSQYAADAICESVDKWERLTGEALNPIRVYRPVFESNAFNIHGRSAAENTEDDGAEDNSDEFTSAGIPLEDLSSSQDENCVPRAFSAEPQLLMAELVKAIKDDNFQKSYGLTAKSLEAHVIRAANDPS